MQSISGTWSKKKFTNNAMVSDTFKQQFKDHKGILYALHNAETRHRRQNILNKANKIELEIVIKTLHYICTGEIPISKSNYQRVKTSKRLRYIEEHVCEGDNLRSTLDLSTEEKRNFLLKIGTFPYLFYSIFNWKK